MIDSDAFGLTVTASEGVAGRGTEADDAWLAFDADGVPLAVGEPLDFRPVAEEASATEPPAAASVSGLPEALALHAAAPNPFAARTALAYDLPEGGRVRLVVYDVLGRVVAVLVDGEQEAGRHVAVFDASSLPSGTYLVRLEAPNVVLTQRVTRLR